MDEGNSVPYFEDNSPPDHSAPKHERLNPTEAEVKRTPYL